MPKELKEILSECMREAGSIEDLAERLIAADVAPVRHGEWVVKDLNNPFYESKKAPHCSVCGKMNFIRYDYCPDCGTKMDGERSDDA